MATVSIVRAASTDFDVETLRAPLGGMSPFVQANDKVLLKVNLLSGKAPAKAVATHPEFVRTVARAVKRAGGAPYIGDSPAGPFTKRVLDRAYRRSGFEKMAGEEAIVLNRETGAKRLGFLPLPLGLLSSSQITSGDLHISSTADFRSPGGRAVRVKNRSIAT